ncbi:MAG: hypothetical protein FP820_10720 [Sulfurimonas sp.]|nr:hypothetical protein [Sulfurimonas sp.]MBU1215902.1 hypothetical protein [bacterium]MBU1435581.1 hypothetical protein [bacterium]MBU1502495.1 hypothetical protein [bacterium]MBU3938138.1 hypothetical protein [bacterium]
MQTEYIHLLEPTPKLHSKKCKLISFCIRIFLQFTTFVVPLIIWYFYDFFIALLSLVLTFIIMGIIRSKLRNSVIPFNQREYQYSDKAIADWYSAKELCYEENPDSSDL